MVKNNVVTTNERYVWQIDVLKRASNKILKFKIFDAIILLILFYIYKIFKNLHFFFFRCHACSKAFSQAANLTAHARTHSGEKPFRCPVCDRRFSQSSSVTTHMRTHSGERPYRWILYRYMNYYLCTIICAT